jgi:hypothetical protein
MNWIEHAAYMGEMENTYKNVARKPQENNLEDLKTRWEDVRMDLREIRWKIMNWSNLFQDRNQ